MSDTTTVNPCITCGACCAHFRCTFHWSEADDATPNGVPVEMTVDLNQFYRAMKGTNQEKPYCIALEGEVGKQVACSIHARRSASCRTFDPSYLNGVHHERCDAARIAHGMLPLTPADWEAPEDEPKDPGRFRPAA